MALSHVLVATDLSEPARLSYRHAVRFARAFGAKLSVLHADEAYDEESADIPAFQRHLEKNEVLRAKRMMQVRADFAALGIDPLRIEVRRGTAREQVARFVDEEQVDLIVLAHHRRQLVESLVLGSTVTRILRISTVPVLVVSVPAEGPVVTLAQLPQYKHILAPSDLGDTSRDGLAATVEVAAGLGAQVTAVHVRKWPPGADEDQPKIDDAVYADALAKLHQQLDGLEPAPTAAIAFGERPADRIVSTAAEVGAELISLPSTGKGTLERIFLGSVAERVCKLSTLPVLVIPAGALAR